MIMLTRRYIPRPPLSAFVRCFWYAEGAGESHSRDSVAPAPLRDTAPHSGRTSSPAGSGDVPCARSFEKLLPTGEPSIVFDLGHDTIQLYDPRDLSLRKSYSAAVLAGARADCFVIDTDQQDRVAGIQFLPGGVFPFLRVPSSETEGITVDLEELWRGRAGEMRERLLAAPNVDSMFRILERRLMAQLVRPLQLHPAVGYGIGQLQLAGSAGRVGTVIERTGLSSRRFIELFHAEVGLTPKVFSRVRRFQQVLQTIRQREEMNWADIALECGYYDQAHFIHDFRSFSGLTPTEYMARATPHINHIPLL